MDIWDSEIKLGFTSKEVISGSMCKREFTLTCKVLSNRNKRQGGAKRTIIQYHLNNWADNSGISEENISDIKKLIEIVCGHVNNKKPIVVHCSAGCGRTGTFIAICNIIMAVEELKLQIKLKPKCEYDFTPRISVFSTVRKLREQRWTMVKTESQYRSIYEFLRFYYSK